MTVFDIRVEVENVSDFEEIKRAIELHFTHKKIYEISCQNVD